jgi:hypothetical protein
MTRRDDLRRVDQAIARVARIATGREGARLRSERSGVSLSQPAVTILAALRSAGDVRSSEVGRLTGLIVGLTPKGRRASEAYRAAADELMAEMLSSWSAADLHDLATSLERVVRDFCAPPRSAPGGERMRARARS